MGIPFSPSAADVERYRRLRALSRGLSEKIFQTVPPRAYDAIGDAIGILQNGVLILDTMDVSSVLQDCCLYDWFEDGRNLVQQYAEANPANPETEEAHLLKAYCQAEYRILTVLSTAPGAGVYVRDILYEEELFVMDLAFSRTLERGFALATRTIPLGEYWMTSGAPLPIASADDIEPVFRQMKKLPALDPGEGPAVFPTLVVRACLAAGAAEHIRYEGAGDMRRERPRMPAWPGSKRHRRPR